MGVPNIFTQQTRHDPRMQGFRDRSSVDEVVAPTARRVRRLDVEPVPLRATAGRALGEEIGR